MNTPVILENTILSFDGVTIVSRDLPVAQRWMGNPQRFLHYTTVMPLNFKANAPDYQDVFAGSSAEQIQAVRDFLMLYPQVADWALLKHRPGPGTQGAK